MKAQELRIGNYIQHFYHGKCTHDKNDWIEVNLLDILSILEDEIEDYRPIPITENWLLKFGFIHNGLNYDYDRFTFHAQAKKDDYFINTEFSIKNDKCSIIISYNIKYVHQLQNVIFALTQRELTIKQQS